MADLASGAEREIAILHGMGPKEIRLLKEAMTDHGLAFTSERRIDPMGQQAAYLGSNRRETIAMACW